MDYTSPKGFEMPLRTLRYVKRIHAGVVFGYYDSKWRIMREHRVNGLSLAKVMQLYGDLAYRVNASQIVYKHAIDKLTRASNENGVETVYVHVRNVADGFRTMWRDRKNIRQLALDLKVPHPFRGLTP